MCMNHGVVGVLSGVRGLSSYTCLTTGASNGEFKVWNFSSGSCISVLKPSSGSKQEVTSVMAVRGALIRSFLVAGWDRKVSTSIQTMIYLHS